MYKFYAFKKFITKVFYVFLFLLVDNCCILCFWCYYKRNCILKFILWLILIHTNTIIICGLTLYSSILLNLFVRSSSYFGRFLMISHVNTQVGAGILLLSFQSVWIISFLCFIVLVRTLVKCWIEVMRNSVFALFSILERNKSIFHHNIWYSVQLLSHVWLCNRMDCSTPGFPVHHQLRELAQNHVHRVGEVIQPSHLLSSRSPPAFSLSQHQGLFQWVSSLHQVAKVLELWLQHQSFQWIFRIDFL